MAYTSANPGRAIAAARPSIDRALRKLFPSTSRLTFNPLFRAAVNAFDVVPRLVFPEFRALPPNHLRIRIGVGNRLFNNQSDFLVHARDFWMFVFAEGIATMHSDVLDIGVGCGRWAHWLRDYNFRGRRFAGSYVGIDIDEEAIAWCRQNYDAERFRFYRSSDPSVSYNHTAACFIVRDANGQALSYFYFENEPGVAKSAERQARDARRAALTDQIERLSHDVDALNVAARYLGAYLAQYPSEGGDETTYFRAFRLARLKGSDVISPAALTAPDGYGVRINASMTKLQRLGERTDSLTSDQLSTVKIVGGEIYNVIGELRSIEKQIDLVTPRYAARLRTLHDELKTIAEN